MKSQVKLGVIFAAVIIVAVMLRAPRLTQRPMHTDEAVHAVKFSKLLEQNLYRYDSSEYHGPTLNYFTLIPAWLSNAKNAHDLTEFTLRIVPVFFGIVLVCMPLLLLKSLGRNAALFAALFTAISPAFVYYSRYYIQEMLLVCFTFGVIISVFRYSQNKSFKWAILSGLFLALMHATKETCIIAFAAMLSAMLLTRTIQNKTNEPVWNIAQQIKAPHFIAAVITAMAVSAAFHSSFFTNPRGIIDSLLTYKTYFYKAGQNQLHIHPWYYYLKMLIYFRYNSGPAWSEAFILILALAGAAAAVSGQYFRGRNISLIRFFTFYTLIMTIIYSAIPYKTPWSMLSFYHGMIIMASIGAAVFIKISTTLWRKLVVYSVLVITVLSLASQAHWGSFIFYADPRNPYVYAHTSNDIFYITQRIKNVAQVHPDGKNTYIHVICTGGDYWPLPWYLRDYKNIGWWNNIEKNISPAPIIIASPDIEPEIMKILYEIPPPGKKNLYVPLFDENIQLRPNVELRGYVTQELWNKYQQNLSDKK